MRIFGGEQVSRLMDFLKVPEDQPLEAGMVTRAIETAQTKVESFYFDQRKHLVEYDDVMNRQRQIFYKRRLNLLDGGLTITSKQIDQALEKEIAYLANIYAASGINKVEADMIIKEFQLILPIDPRSADMIESGLIGKDAEEVQKILANVISEARKAQKERFGDDTLAQVERYVLLESYDELWMNHLDAIDNLRDGIGLRGYAQKDPLVEYKQESYAMFESLLTRIDQTVARRVFRVQVQMPTEMVKPLKGVEKSAQGEKKIASSTKENRLGRNDPCFCGSGKKWKNCHYPKLG
jgi:preprotein translocase subunit SecA